MPISFDWEVVTVAPTTSTTTVTPAVLSGLSAIRDWALDPITGDLELVNGDFPMVSGVDGIVSDLKSRLQTWLGEWFLDPTIGVDYLGRILGKAGRKDGEAEWRSQILATPGITGITDFRLSIADRIMSVVFRVSTDFGVLIDITLNAIQGSE